MVHYKPVPFVLQANKFPNPRWDLNHSGKIVLPEFGDYFINALLVWVPSAGARRTSESMGRLVTSQEHYPAALQTFYARIIKERVTPVHRLHARSERCIRDRVPNQRLRVAGMSV